MRWTALFGLMVCAGVWLAASSGQVPDQTAASCGDRRR